MGGEQGGVEGDVRAAGDPRPALRERGDRMRATQRDAVPGERGAQAPAGARAMPRQGLRVGSGDDDPQGRSGLPGVQATLQGEGEFDAAGPRPDHQKPKGAAMAPYPRLQLRETMQEGADRLDRNRPLGGPVDVPVAGERTDVEGEVVEGHRWAPLDSHLARFEIRVPRASPWKMRAPALLASRCKSTWASPKR